MAYAEPSRGQTTAHLRDLTCELFQALTDISPQVAEDALRAPEYLPFGEDEPPLWMATSARFAGSEAADSIIQSAGQLLEDAVLSYRSNFFSVVKHVKTIQQLGGLFGNESALSSNALGWAAELAEDLAHRDVVAHLAFLRRLRDMGCKSALPKALLREDSEPSIDSDISTLVSAIERGEAHTINPKEYEAWRLAFTTDRSRTQSILQQEEATSYEVHDIASQSFQCSRMSFIQARLTELLESRPEILQAMESELQDFNALVEIFNRRGLALCFRASDDLDAALTPLITAIGNIDSFFVVYLSAWKRLSGDNQAAEGIKGEIKSKQFWSQLRKSTIENIKATITVMLPEHKDAFVASILKAEEGVDRKAPSQL